MVAAGTAIKSSSDFARLMPKAIPLGWCRAGYCGATAHAIGSARYRQKRFRSAVAKNGSARLQPAEPSLRSMDSGSRTCPE
jgi:hypothetical protein